MTVRSASLVRTSVVVVLGLLAVACGPDVTGLGPSSSPGASTPAGAGADAPGVLSSDVLTFPSGAAADERLGARPSDGSGTSPGGAEGDEETDARTGSPSEVTTGLVVGDSLTVSAAAEIRAALAAEGLVVVDVDALEGRRIARGTVEPGVDAVLRLRLAGADPDVWILALGTNDVGAQVDRETMRADIAEILRLIPRDAAVLWVDTRVEYRADGSVAANALFRQQAVFDPRVEVVDWHAVGGEEGVLVADGVHLTPTGRARFAAALADAVGEHYDVVPLPTTQR